MQEAIADKTPNVPRHKSAQQYFSRQSGSSGTGPQQRAALNRGSRDRELASDLGARNAEYFATS
jgi:hypothetical protein